ncbi:MAG: acetyl-CoA carboxylase biotin carboxyl carrier protein [Rhodospirillaceae bacterium]|nr:acetyl-CoA carboxylase biotin carboxyl carrier protein [Rhodospirillaceae bacterium]
MKNFDIDPDLIRRLAELLRETELAEIEFAEGTRRLRLARFVAPPAPSAFPVSVPIDVPVADVAAHTGTVVSPMVGTVYFSSEPGAPPFISVGDKVKVDQTLLIIEAMKVMNPIRATRAGTVSRILVGNGAPVEYGEPLLIVE